ncbi:MAG: S8 family serine peptidase [Bacteroidales bacterium]|nr:S8 family serine peptidase [Bacteroidales bacterium]
MSKNIFIKRLALFVFLTTSVLSQTNAQTPVYYYGEDGTPIQLQEKNNERYIYVESADLTDSELSTLNTYADSIKRFSAQIYKLYLKNTSLTAFETFVSATPKIVFASKEMLCNGTNDIVWPSNKIYVEINENSSVEDLETVLTTNNIPYTEIINHPAYEYGFYVVLSDKFNTLNYANTLYNNGTPILISQPSFWSFLKLANTRYPSQWGLHNTGQFDGTPGIDINVEPAWQIAEGENITVAVIDLGVESTHEDLAANMLPGVDLVGLNGGNNYYLDCHGTACAGVIAAVDNNVGIKGVAYKSKILSIRVATSDTTIYPVVPDVLSRAITIAADNSDVISCSWECSTGDYINGNPDINRAISYAVTRGRGGNGCVMVFASGNNNSPYVRYPASNNLTIAVGAINRCGQRKSYTTFPCDSVSTWGSNYGEKLSVMAPGNKVLTCDLNNTYKYFDGTSFAVPHVAGVAALILSANPNLTSQQVRNIIELTANKVSSNIYNYTDTIGHPNGKWTKPMGYGLVDAYEAVKAALDYDLYTKDYSDDNGVEPSDIGGNGYYSPDIWVRRNRDGGFAHQVAVMGDTNYVYVKIHNKGNSLSSKSDSIRLFMKKNITSSIPVLNFQYWPSGWQQVAVAAIPPIPKNGEKTVCLPVKYDALFNKHILLSRIESQYDLLSVPEISFTLDNVSFNNNISIKNSSSAEYFLYDGWGSGLYVTALASEVSDYDPFKLTISTTDDESGTNILDEAEVTVILSENLSYYWQNNNIIPEGLKHLYDNAYLVVNENVELNGFEVPEGYDADITLKYNFLTRKSTNNEIYYNTIQRYNLTNDDDKLVGGLTIQVEKPERVAADRFHANAGNDTAVLLNTTATLHATQISEDATYRWYDINRNFLYEGLNYSPATTTQTTKYILEVTADNDGYRDLDTVKVTVVPGCIRSITPNPVTDNWTTVSYEFVPTVSTAQLLIYNTATAILVDSYNNLSGTSLDINVSNYSDGSYSVVLMCDGIAVDSKVLIKQ